MKKDTKFNKYTAKEIQEMLDQGIVYKSYQPTANDKKLDNYLKRTFGIGYQKYAEISEEQGNVCAICGCIEQRKRLVVDHCHQTGKIRGLLCSPCNLGLGSFKDNIVSLQGAILYLEKFNGL